MITLDATDKALMKQCPFTEVIPKKPSKAQGARLERINRLWRAKLLRGEVLEKDKLHMTLTPDGRVALYGDAAAAGVPVTPALLGRG